MQYSSMELAMAPVPVSGALDVLLQDITCLVQAHAISPKEISRALKQLLKQFAADEATHSGCHGPCQGLPTPYELVRWLLAQQKTVYAAVSTGSKCSSKHKQSQLQLPCPPEDTKQQEPQDMHRQQDQPQGQLHTAAAPLLAAGVLPPQAAEDATAHNSKASSSKHTTASSRPPLEPVTNILHASPSPAAAEPLKPAAVTPAATTYQLPKRRTKVKKQRQASSRIILTCKLQSRSTDCCLAVAALDEVRSFTVHQAPITSKPAGPAETRAGVTAAAAAAVAQANHPSTKHTQQQQQQQRLCDSYLQLCQGPVSSQEAAAPAAGSGPAAAKLGTALAQDLPGANPACLTGNGAAPADTAAGASQAPLATPAAAGAAGGDISAKEVSLQQQQQQQRRPARGMPQLLALVHMKRSLLIPPKPLDSATATTPSATEAPANPLSSADAATAAQSAENTLKKLIALKKLALASFQADLRCRLTAEIPGKQYCHVNLPGAPAGGVCNLAGYSGSTHAAVSCRDGRGNEGSEEPQMLRLFRDAAEAKCRGGDKQRGRDTIHKQRNKGRLEQHKHEAAEYQRRREEAAAARLSALKNASLPEYLDMLKQAKNGRLQQVLKQTDDCLRQLAAKLGVQGLLDAATAPGANAEADATDGSSSSDEAGILGSSGAWANLAAQLHADIQQQPAMLKGGQLREYQMQGVRWLVGLSEKGLNGILADDMGLGKTVQVIAMICHCVEVQESPGPFLIVCPASVVSNWAAELSRWAPDLSVVQYKGSAEAREDVYVQQVRKKSFNVLLTTYELLMAPADRARLSRIRWRGIVVDEGHRLKNAECKLAQELRAYNSRSRLLLTGTPLQNKLSELWSLLNFLMPDVFNSADDFDSWFGAPLQAIKDAQSGGAADVAGSAAEASLLSQEEYLLVTNRLHQVLRPFMMRRLKEAVATELPGKTEVVLRCQLSAYQAALYDLVKTKLRNEAAAGTAGSSSNSGPAAAGVKGVNNTVMELRNICNHPVLSKLHPEYGEDLLKDPINSSSSILGASGIGGTLPAVLRLSCKVDLLDQVLVRLHAGGHKVLLFCTMTRLLDVLEEYLDWRGFSHLRLDGSTTAQDRADAVNNFNDPNSGVFLFMLSLRAGGVGLNLQAADTVIMYDSDWNPQIDLQAQARAHRMGQTKQVLVVRLVAEHTIEEHILQVAEQKRKFADSSITGGFFDGSTSAEARRQYLLQILDTIPAAAAAAGAAAGMTAGTLNKLLARNDQELLMWQDRDRKLLSLQQQQQQVSRQETAAAAGSSAAAAAVACAFDAAGEQSLCRLATEEDSAELIAAAREAAAPKPEEDLSSYGRGMRGAKSADTGQQTAAAARRQRRAVAAAAETPAAAAAAVKEKRPPGRPRKNPAPAAAAAAANAGKAVADAIAATKAASAAASTAADTVEDAATVDRDSAAADAQATLESTADSPLASAKHNPPPPPAAAKAATTGSAGATAAARTNTSAQAEGKQQQAALGRAGADHSAADQPAVAAAAGVEAAQGSNKPKTGSAAAPASKQHGSFIQLPQSSLAAAEAAKPTKVAAAGAPAELCTSSKQTGTGRRPGRPSKAEVAARLAAEAAAAAVMDSRTDSSSRPTRKRAAAAVQEASIDVEDPVHVCDAPPAKKPKVGDPEPASVLPAAAAGGGSGGGSIKMSETVAVCCGSVQGWYSIVREEVLLKQTRQQQQDRRHTRGSSSSSSAKQQQQQQGELWMSKSAFMKLGGVSHKQDADKAIKLLLCGGQQGFSLGKYVKQYERWEQQQEKERDSKGSGGSAAAAGSGGSSEGRRSSSPQVESALAAAVNTTVQGGADSDADVLDEGKGAAATAAPPVKKRGRPSKAETAAKLAAEAAAAFGSSIGVKPDGTAAIDKAATSGRKRTAAAALGAAPAAAAASKRSKASQTAAAAAPGSSNDPDDVHCLVVDAAAAFDRMCRMQQELQHSIHGTGSATAAAQTQLDVSGTASEEVVSAVRRMGHVFESLWV